MINRVLGLFYKDNKPVWWRIFGLVVVLSLLNLLAFMPFFKSAKHESILISDTVRVAKPPAMEYGILTDSLILKEVIIKPAQSFTEIMAIMKISHTMAMEIANKWNTISDIRKIRSGNTMMFYLDKNDSTCIKYIVYEADKLNYIRVSLADSIEIKSFEKKVDLRIKKFKGQIGSSLWKDMKSYGLDPELALKMSDIYAWTIDFFAIQKGDEFRVVFQEIYAEGAYAGISTIDYCMFKHNGREFYAFHFIQDSLSDYFNENAQSLRKTFLKAPLRFSRISSGYSNSRFHPILRIYRPHHGVDYAAPAGTPVYSIGDGTVTDVSVGGGAGRIVKIKHNSAYSTAYLHLSKFGENIRPGSFVRQGQVIGYVGSSGLSTGPHLDFRFYKNGQPANPSNIEADPVEPVDSSNLKAYFLMQIPAIKDLQRGDFP